LLAEVSSTCSVVAKEVRWLVCSVCGQRGKPVIAKSDGREPECQKLGSGAPSHSEKNTDCSKDWTNKGARNGSTEETIRLGLGELAGRVIGLDTRPGDERRESPQKRKLLHIPVRSLRHPSKVRLYSIKLLINKHIKYCLAALCLPFGTHIAH